MLIFFSVVPKLHSQHHLNHRSLAKNPQFLFPSFENVENSNNEDTKSGFTTFSENHQFSSRLLKSEFLSGLTDQVNIDSITTTIQDLQNFDTRYEYSPGRKAAANYIFQRFNRYGLDVLNDSYEFTTYIRQATSQVNTEKVWIIGDNGTILHSENAGNSWSTQQRDIGDILLDVCFIDSLRGWCASYYFGNIYKTIDGGKAWEVISTNIEGYFYGVAFVDSLHGWIGVTSFDFTTGQIYATADGGFTWTLQLETSETTFWDIHFTTPDSGWAVGSKTYIASTTNGGTSWNMNRTYFGHHLAVDFTDSQHGWIVGVRFLSTGPFGKIYKTSDGGQNWQNVYSEVDGYFRAVDFFDQNHGWVAGKMGKILYTNDGGLNWQLKNNSENSFVDIVATGPGSCMAFTSTGVYQTVDEGANWEVYTPPPLKQNSENIVAIKSGSVNPDSVIILGAHYDSWSDESMMTYAPGANDNASGVAGIVELSRILSQYDSKYTLEFVAFSAEEIGLLGSEHYAASAEVSGKNIKAMINFDMIAYASSSFWVVDLYGDDNSKWLVELAAEMATNYTGVVPEKKIQIFANSDHYSFLKRGYATLFMIHPDPFAYPYIHTNMDELNKLTIQYEVEIVKTGIATIANIAEIVTDVENMYVYSTLPDRIVTYQNYPNPFNSSTTITFLLSKQSHVEISIFNSLGQIIRNLKSDNNSAGTHSIEWDGRDDFGEDVVSGIYFYNLKASDPAHSMADFSETRKMILIR